MKFKDKEDFLSWVSDFWHKHKEKDDSNNYQTYQVRILFAHKKLSVCDKIRWNFLSLSHAESVIDAAEKTGFCRGYALEKRRVVKQKGFVADDIEYEDETQKVARLLEDKGNLAVDIVNLIEEKIKLNSDNKWLRDRVAVLESLI